MCIATLKEEIAELEKQEATTEDSRKLENIRRNINLKMYRVEFEENRTKGYNNVRSRSAALMVTPLPGHTKS